MADRARRIGQALSHRLGILAGQYPQIGEIRGRGAMMAIELILPDPSLTPDPKLTAAVLAGCTKRGLVTLGCGSYGNVIRMLPPLVTEFHLVEAAMDILADAFGEAVG